MKSDIKRCAEHDQFRKIDAAFRNGDLAALRAAVDEPDSVPNGTMPQTIGHCLEYAIYHSPLSFIRTLLEIGADPNPVDHSGFPPLIAALSCSHSEPGSPGRSDVLDIVKLLLTFGADPNQRGLNDYTLLQATRFALLRTFRLYGSRSGFVSQHATHLLRAGPDFQDRGVWVQKLSSALDGSASRAAQT